MEYLFHLFIIFCIFSMLALTLNLVVGFTGLPSLAHAGFFGIGAYTTAIMTTRFEGNFFVSIVVGLVITFAVAFFLGLVLGRFRDDYFLLVTLAFVFIMQRIFLNWGEVTRGPLGIPGIPPPVIFGVSLSQPWLYALLLAGALVLVYGACHFLVSSSFGRVLKAIREDEDALKVFGYRTDQYKLAVFSLSALGAAFAGAFYASYISFIDPSTFTVHDSVFIWAIIVLGGLARLRGSLVGALILVVLPEALRFVGFSPDAAAQMRVLIYGALLVGMLLYRPQGLVGEYRL
ncbi:branched-chain amino acid ABC transporter permease [Candidatus Uhrbacteria bacterium]|nr:branched-chain amino acid ABC transporter permease [Candidatus Uhrbacteria bacterium]